MDPDRRALVERETLKLLVQAAWADDEVQAAERRSILDIAHSLRLPAEELTAIDAALRGQGPLPPLNLGVLRGHEDEVLAIVAALLAADQRLAAAEHRFLQQVRALLQGGDSEA